MRKCPYCAEEIQDDAVKCKHCGSLLTDTARTPGLADTLDYSRTIMAGQIAPGMLLAGQYHILGETPLGSGGMGEVWKAEDTELGTVVGIKVLPPVLARDATAIDNLKREAMIGRQLANDHICKLFSFHSDRAVKFLVMEFVDGRTLAQLLTERDDRKLSWEELEPIATQIGEALDYAHAATYTDARGRQVKGVLHRDIKPQNIMVTHDGAAKLLDFGIAREIHNSMTQVTGRTSQTPLYASPEQFRGEPLTAASDIYSFTAVLYECLAGHPLVVPHGDLSWQILQKPFEPLSSQSSSVNTALAAGLEKDTNQRRVSASSLLSFSDESRRHPVSASPARAENAQPKDSAVSLTRNDSPGSDCCPACGHKAQPSDAFCTFCGRQLVVSIAKCSKCGGYLHSDDLYCTKCGQKIGAR